MTSEDINKLSKLLTKAVDEAVKRETQHLDAYVRREVDKQLREYGEAAVRRVVEGATKKAIEIEVRLK